MTPDERAAFEQRMKDRQAQGGGFGGGQGSFAGGNFGGRGGQGNFQRNGQGANAAGRTGGATAADAKTAAPAQNATTIDALFGPLPPVETRGRAWLYINKQLKPIELRLGISDGTYTEILNDPNELQPNTEVVTTFITPEAASRPSGSNPANNPLMPQRGRGPGGPGRGR